MSKGGGADGDDALALAQRNAMRYLSLGQFLNSCTWTVTQTAQTGFGLQLAPSAAALLAAMAAVRSFSSAAEFLLLPICGAVSDSLGRKPVMLARALVSTVFPALIASFPSYKLFIGHRLISILTWRLTETAQQASLADVYEGQELAVAMAKCRSQMGVAMLIGPLIGGWLSERSFRACYILSAAFGAINTLMYVVCFRETLGARGRASGAQPDGKDSSGGRVGVDFSSANPLGFLKLFRNGRALSWSVLLLLFCLSAPLVSNREKPHARTFFTVHGPRVTQNTAGTVLTVQTD